MGKKTEIIAFKVSSKEREILEQLADRLYRNRSDAIRFAIRKVMKELETINKITLPE